MAQFSKLANVYFLCFAIMQLIPGLSTTGNKTNIIPLSIFVSISMAKEGFDDYRRHRLDKLENARDTLALDTSAPLTAGVLNWRKLQWCRLSVGDIIKLKRDEPVPADIVLLKSKSARESNVTYVETMGLDGETNLKRKITVKSVAEACATPEKLIVCSVKFVTEDPNSDLSTFKGRVVVDEQTLPLTVDNVVLRGSIIRNTDEVIAIVVYSGEECKIRVRPREKRYARIKAPRLQSVLNRIIMLVASFVVALSMYNTLAYQAWKSNIESKLFYLSAADVPFHQEIFGFIIMFATMVPLSFYTTMEIIKLSQIFFLNTDVEMYDEKSDIPFEARTSTINEDLGQVTHIFSDKTGTLTENEMKFRKLYIAKSNLVADKGESRNQYTTWVASQSKLYASTEYPSSGLGVERKTEELVDYIFQSPNSKFSQDARLMLLCMALCHNCVPETREQGTVFDFQASSPDEIALVRAAQEMGFLMRNREHDTVTIETTSPKDKFNRTEKYKILSTIEFSNTRKRMSVAVRFPDSRICVICKGADSVILARLKPVQRAPQDVKNPSIAEEVTHGVIDDCIRSIKGFANESLRTLVYAYRFLDEKEYNDWRKIWDEATTTLTDHEKMIEDAAERIEVDFELAGVTGLEDKLQLGVPETIEKLLRANIRIWILTGDKQETAINIGRSCGLTQENSEIIILTDKSRLGSMELEETMKSGIPTVQAASHSVVIVDGDTLATIYEDPSGVLEALFFDLVALVDSVICCRAQPSQKAQLVGSVRKRVPNCVTLAVGDGANDIAMIQEAQIGIGITGKEGLQAARSSDYSIAQFRFLQRLLLVHGRWNYVRTCKYVLGTLWKEIVFFLTQALFQRWNGYTGTSLYEPSSLATFNTLFTSLPVIVIGIFEKDLAASTLMAVPELYSSMGQSNGAFSIWVYLGWMAMAVAESMIIYFSILFLFANADATMRDNSLFPMGDLGFIAAIIVISMKLQIIEMHNKSIVAFLSIVLSVGAVFGWNILLTLTYSTTSIYKARGEFFNGFGKDLTWWLTLVFIVVCVYLLECGVSGFRKALFPTDTDVFQELENGTALREESERTTGAAATSRSRRSESRYSDEPGCEMGEVGIALRPFR